MTAFTFTTKDGYLQYRSQWKEQYRQLSADIRDFKFCRKHSSIGTDHYERIKKAHSTQFGFWPQTLAWAGRKKATEMLEELKLAKVEAQRQYLAARARELAA